MNRSAFEDSLKWDAAIEAYHKDDVVLALDLIKDCGIGDRGDYVRWFRLIESEALSRRASRVEQITPWLSLEFVPKELLDHFEPVARRAVNACSTIARRLGWSHDVVTRIAILMEEVDAPWAVFPHGYCASKENYEKICLPNYLVDDPAEFSQAVAHEYAHVIVTALTQDRAPRWLAEAIAVLAEDDACAPERSSIQYFWKDAVQLELTLESVKIEISPQDEIWCAYQQCGWIGRFLAERGGDKSIVKLLRAHGREGLWRNLGLTLRGKSLPDEALKQTFGMGVDQLFDDAYRLLIKG